MKHPRLQWCHQIAVTSVCWPKDPVTGQLSGCSNCTRLLAHEKKRFVMSPDDFEKCATVAAEFIKRSPPCPWGRSPKVIGIFGGEPLMSPHFPDYVDILCKVLPSAKNRGLWTSLNWKEHKHAPLCHRLLGTNGPRQGFNNWNMHEADNVCEHHPSTVAVQDVVADKAKMWDLIDKCWLNDEWSACYAYDANGQPKFYFCEVAASWDRVLNLGTGLDVVSGVWDHDLILADMPDGTKEPRGMYARQVETSCLKCGHPLPLKRGRRDMELKDDISPSNLVQLQEAGSPMVARGDFVEFGPEQIEKYNADAERDGWRPHQYIKAGNVRSSKVVKTKRNKS